MSLSTGRDATGQVNQAHVTAASAQRHRAFHRYALGPRDFLRELNVSYQDVLNVTTSLSSERIFVHFPVGHRRASG